MQEYQKDFLKMISPTGREVYIFSAGEHHVVRRGKGQRKSKGGTRWE